MSRTPALLRRTTRLTAVALATAGLAAGLAGLAAPAYAAPRLTAAAREAGLQAGNATMGWSQHSTGISAAARQEPDRRSSGRSGMAAAASSGRVYGIDVASYQGNVNWTTYWKQGKRFAYVKATEGTGYTNPYFGSQYGGSHARGFIRGAYHFAIPSKSSGKKQAEFFVAHGGGWSRDGQTLPGTLDIEYNPYGSTCYGLSKSSMVSWIRSFTTRYQQLTGRDAVIYSTTDWWKQCTGNSNAFGSTNPLWIARYSSSPGTLPAGWGWYTFWQYSGTTIDKDRFNGSMTRLRVLANNG